MVGFRLKDFFKRGFSYNPLIGAALLFALLAYGRLLKLPAKDDFKCLLSTSCIFRLTGTQSSNAVKSASSSAYTAQFSPSSAETDEGAVCQCRGNVKIVLPAAFVESYFPGKLYSAAKNGGIVCENGARLELIGSFSKDGSAFFVKSARALGWGSSLFSKILRFRAACRMQFRRMLYAWGDAGGLLLALLSGMREYADKTVSSSFRSAGLMHVLALSGMHLSLFSGLALFAGKGLLGRRAAAGLQIFAVCAFTWFAGVSPSLFRAFLSALLAVFIRASGMRAAPPLKILALTFLLHAAIFPAHVFTPAFTLSYGALTSILLFGEALSAFFAKIAPPFAAASLGTSAGAQILTTPITAFIFGTVTPAGIIASALISPAVSVFIYSGLACIAACLAFPPLVPLAARLMQFEYALIKRAALLFAQFPRMEF
ncbi:MAG: ComEC/Rec2 family competence protein [Treponema sp.]